MTTGERQAAAKTATRIMDIAEELIQKRGFNGFSYADIASELRITTASLHYHFAGKAELGRALIERYSERFFAALSGIDNRFSEQPARLRAYADLYASVLREERLCLCGMLAAEYNTLPGPMRDAVVRFFEENESWLSRVLREGREVRTLEFAGSPKDAARMIIGAFEGAMLVARPYGDVTRFESSADRIIGGLEARSLIS